jgi:hypothetical protein
MHIIVAMIIGVGAVAFPLIAPWSLVLCFAAALVNSLNSESRFELVIRAIVSVLLFFAAASMFLPAPLITGLLASAALSKKRPDLAACVLLLQTASIDTLQAIIASEIYNLNIEAAAPSIIASLFILIFIPAINWSLLTLALTPLLIAYLGHKFWIPPIQLMFICSIFPLLIAAKLASTSISLPSNGWRKKTQFTIAFFLAVGWFFTPPRIPDNNYFLLPQAPQAFEEKFYQNYREALQFSGLPFREVNNIELIPKNSLVLLPWNTASIAGESESERLLAFKKLANERKWTVVLVGEHTNMGGVKDRVRTLVGRDVLRNDLTVPMKNSDESGPLHVGDFRAWPHTSIFNRGASVEIMRPLDRVLLGGDGWWGEPDIGEWLWVGDYVWHPSDRDGRLTLAASFESDGARWVVVGDTSAFTNRQLIADPRAVSKILEMATLWPLFIKDFILLVFGVLFIAGIPLFIAYVFPLFIFLPLGISFNYFPNDGRWRDVWLGESGFSVTNFNNVISDEPFLMAQPYRLIRMPHPAKGVIEIPSEPAIIFALVDGAAEFTSVKLTKCHRIGSLKSDEGPYLMDAQSCALSGEAEILIGDKQGAAAFRIPHGGSYTYVILDRRFLSHDSPKENSKWLIDQIKDKNLQ